MDGGEILAIFFIVVFASVLFGLVGCGAGRSDVQDEAVKAGAAEYYLDANHQRQFRWITATNQPAKQ